MRYERRLVRGTPLWLGRTPDGRVARIDRRFEDVVRGTNTWDPSYQADPDLETARLLAPVVPSKVVCIGLNYRRHAEEMNKPVPSEPLMFLKPSTSVIAGGEPIVLPADSDEVHHEGELAVVIGRTARDVPEDRADDYILGYTLMNDVTARDIQRREQRYTRAKGFDTFAPLGPAIVAGLDPNALHIETRVNGVVRQTSGVDDLIFPIPKLVAFVSRVMTLLPGDVISTGTPSGVGPIRAGDQVEVSIAEIGTLSNPVLAPPGA